MRKQVYMDRRFLGEGRQTCYITITDNSGNENNRRIHFDVSVGVDEDVARIGAGAGTKQEAYQVLEKYTQLQNMLEKFIVHAAEAIANSELPEGKEAGGTAQQQLELE